MLNHQIFNKINVRVFAQKHKLKEPFIISRHIFHHSIMMVVELSQNGFIGRGESEPHEYDYEILENAVQYSQSIENFFADGMSIEKLNQILPSGPIRNAFDCALWDLICKQNNKRIWEILDLNAPKPLKTVYTISINEPKIMAQKAIELKNWSKFKIKLGGKELNLDIERVKAIRNSRKDAELIVDANGAWTLEILKNMSDELAKLDVKLIEQPILQDCDQALLGFNSKVPLCADESCLDCSSLPYIKNRYQYINIKLDKTGGFTEALKLTKAAKELGLGIMVGCMAATSLAMAPAFLIAQEAQFIDLDGPMLLENDIENGMKYEKGLVYAPCPLLWG